MSSRPLFRNPFFHATWWILAFSIGWYLGLSEAKHLSDTIIAGLLWIYICSPLLLTLAIIGHADRERPIPQTKILRAALLTLPLPLIVNGLPIAYIFSFPPQGDGGFGLVGLFVFIIGLTIVEFVLLPTMVTLILFGINRRTKKKLHEHS